MLDPNTKEQYIDNLIIYEFNLPKLKEKYYNKNRVMKKNRSRLLDNSDDKFVKFLSDEKETKLLINTYQDEGYDKGLEQGEISGIRKTAKEMLNEGLPVSVISKCTKLSEEKREALG